MSSTLFYNRQSIHDETVTTNREIVAYHLAYTLLYMFLVAVFMDVCELYAEYDAIMIGRRKDFSNLYLHKNSRISEKYALIIMRYAFEKYLQWSPEVVKANMNMRVLKLMHLDLLLNYIIFPVEYNANEDCFYVALLMYGGSKEETRNRIIHVYEKILSGEMAKYPRDYFIGNDGIIRAGICFQYVINNFVHYRNINELYHVFSTENGYRILSEYKLLNICREVYETPVDFLHFVLPPKLKNTLFFNYYKYKFLREMIDKNGRKKREMVNYKLEEAF